MSKAVTISVMLWYDQTKPPFEHLATATIATVRAPVSHAKHQFDMSNVYAQYEGNVSDLTDQKLFRIALEATSMLLTGCGTCCRLTPDGTKPPLQRKGRSNMQQESNSFDTLAHVLYNGEAKVADIKTMPGVGRHTRDELAHALFTSMQRMGIVKGDVLVDKNC